ncbi:uncharacterized protein Nmag_0406 [Natrialba magadii ATCC 43099]|uniref:DUF7344 domain-containing protein n=1 Tax=Natrialba magadii (strain ATCC 43099 / DSM 3394 / CCM 3739 / CIP 104546 / IAM 13178 / JCM 8861 / NBRC 102185 / NCIMB 2190 / MS3) TaxID=547559 RepID=D3SXV4_NATMM|nr:hypothetical protein [Natrialba magadii]ADD03994.1 uncharacterized protein Nmag_0406 [Natrialba magadii ATCC 43099]ELY33151.1 hypothetical protein C500_02444 [Natrialba magadii ATCC 43099]
MGEKRANHVDADQVFGALADQRFRDVLRCLDERETPIELAELADAVASRTHDEPVAALPDRTVERTYIALYHAHVPRLAASGLVSYNQCQELVDTTEPFEPIVKSVLEETSSKLE